MARQFLRPLIFWVKDASIDGTRCNDENDIDGDDDNYDDDEKVAWEETRRKDDDWRREVKVVH